MENDNLDKDSINDEPNTYDGEAEGVVSSSSDEKAESVGELNEFDLSKNLNDASIKSEEDSKFDSLESFPILVIDDDRWIQRIFSQYLKTWGFEYHNASDSYEGIDLAIKHKPLLIFLDIIMPDVTGDIMLKFLKRIESLSQIPVVIISGNLNKDVLKSTYRDGASGFISKPFTKELLLQKILEVLDPRIINKMIEVGVMDEKLLKEKNVSTNVE